MSKQATQTLLLGSISPQKSGESGLENAAAVPWWAGLALAVVLWVLSWRLLKRVVWLLLELALLLLVLLLASHLGLLRC